MTRDIGDVARALGETLTVLRQEVPGSVRERVGVVGGPASTVVTNVRVSVPWPGPDTARSDSSAGRVEGDELHAGPGAPPDGAGVRTGGAP